jgi:hypothetical protein
VIGSLGTSAQAAKATSASTDVLRMREKRENCDDIFVVLRQ